MFIFIFFPCKTLVPVVTIITSFVVCQQGGGKRDNVGGRHQKWRFCERGKIGNKGKIRHCELKDNTQAIPNGLRYKVKKEKQSGHIIHPSPIISHNFSVILFLTAPYSLPFHYALLPAIAVNMIYQRCSVMKSSHCES